MPPDQQTPLTPAGDSAAVPPTTVEPRAYPLYLPTSTGVVTPPDVLANIAIAARSVDMSGTAEALDNARLRNIDRTDEESEDYNTRGLLIAIFEMTLSGREMSFVELARTLAFLYSDDVLTDLGFTVVRDAATEKR
jgi:hypothetical protein